MAVIPNTETFIEINTVNNDDNWEYYRDNNNGLSLEYDGITSGFLGNKKSLTATAVTLPCSTYHLKFAVADRGDSSFDSGVFISEIRSGVPQIETSFASGLDYFVEECLSTTTDSVFITIDEALTQATDYIINITGTATNPDDYILDIPNIITFGVGVTELKFPIEVFADDIIEGEETIVISLSRDFGCGEIVINELVIPIRENVLVEIVSEMDTIIACAENSVQLEVEGATSYVWEPFNAFNNPFVSNPIVNAGFNGWVFVTGTIDPFTSEECIGRDSIFINLVEPEVSIQTDDLQVCEGDTVNLIAINNVNSSNLLWDVTNSFTQPQQPLNDTTIYIPPFSNDFTVVVSVDLAGCVATDTAIIQVDDYDLLEPIFEDTIVCQGEELQLFQQQFIFGTQFSIDPETNVEDPTDPFTTVVANEDIEYTAITFSENNFCADTFMFAINITPNEIEIEQGDTARICLGDSIDLTTFIDPLDGIVTWEPGDSLNIFGNNASADPTVTTQYFVSIDNGACQDFDSIIVFVDSLPDMTISAIPIRDPYCLGDELTFVSPGYFIGDFPLIQHMWDVTTGFVEDSQNNYNVGLNAIDTTTYIRTTTNGACVVMDSITINVVNPMIELNLDEITVCAGESVDFDISSDNEIENIMWSSSVSGEFTCEDCEMTTLQNIQNSTEVTVSAEIEGCPVNGSAEVLVPFFPGGLEILPGEVCPQFQGSLELSFFLNDGIQPGFTFDWFNGNNLLPGLSNQENIVIDIDVANLVSNTFRVELTDTNGCLHTYSSDLSINDSPYSIQTNITPDSILSENDCFFYSDIINIGATFEPPLPPGSDITWTFNGDILEEFSNLPAIRQY